jgi:hypothetical protein
VRFDIRMALPNDCDALRGLARATLLEWGLPLALSAIEEVRNCYENRVYFLSNGHTLVCGH